MRISNISNINFGKRAVMTCNIVDKKENKRVPAKLWRYDLNDSNDVRELNKSTKIPRDIKGEFFTTGYRSGHSGSLYVLKKMNSKDIMGFVETSRHLRPKNAEQSGFVTQVDKVNLNDRFIYTLMPILAQIAREADEKNDNAIIFAIRQEEIDGAKKMKLPKTKNFEPYIPNKKFDFLIDKADERAQIEFK